MKKLFFAMALLVVPALLAFPSKAEAAWVLLGERVVEHTADKDTFHLTHAGAFKGIQLTVHHAAIKILKFQVIYGNGERNWIRTARHIAAGGSTGYIDLPGNRRVIKRVHIWYKTLNHRGPRARIQLFGRK
jgi:hypothetical protein